MALLVGGYEIYVECKRLTEKNRQKRATLDVVKKFDAINDLNLIQWTIYNTVELSLVALSVF